jgi:hypothetical protein
LADLVAKLDKNGVRRVDMREEALQRVANASRVADLGEGLDEPGVNRNSASTFVQKLKVQFAPHGGDGARISSLRRFAVHARLPSGKAKLASSRAARSGRTRKRRVKKMA